MSNFKDLDEANASFEHLKKLYESANGAMAKLQEQNDVLTQENTLLHAKLENCAKANEISKEIMRNSIIDYNTKVQSYIEEIQKLREELHGYKH